MKTIKQIADEIGVTKQAVHKKRKSHELSTALQPFTSTIDGVVYISVDGEVLIKSAFSSLSRKHVDGSISSTVYSQVDGQNELYDILKAELKAKDEQIETLQMELAAERKHSREQSDKLVTLAEQAQMLHAGTMQQKRLSDGMSPGMPKPQVGIFAWISRRRKRDEFR